MFASLEARKTKPGPGTCWLKPGPDMQKLGFVRVRVLIFCVQSGPGLHQTRIEPGVLPSLVAKTSHEDKSKLLALLLSIFSSYCCKLIPFGFSSFFFFFLTLLAAASSSWVYDTFLLPVASSTKAKFMPLYSGHLTEYGHLTDYNRVYNPT